MTFNTFCCIFCHNLPSRICESLLFYSKIALKNSLRRGGGCIIWIISKYNLTSPLKDSIHIQNWSLTFGTLLEVENTPHHYFLSHKLWHRSLVIVSCCCFMIPISSTNTWATSIVQQTLKPNLSLESSQWLQLYDTIS